MSSKQPTGWKSLRRSLSARWNRDVDEEFAADLTCMDVKLADLSPTKQSKRAKAKHANTNQAIAKWSELPHQVSIDEGTFLREVTPTPKLRENEVQPEPLIIETKPNSPDPSSTSLAAFYSKPTTKLPLSSNSGSSSNKSVALEKIPKRKNSLFFDASSELPSGGDVYSHGNDLECRELVVYSPHRSSSFGYYEKQLILKRITNRQTKVRARQNVSSLSPPMPLLPYNIGMKMESATQSKAPTLDPKGPESVSVNSIGLNLPRLASKGQHITVNSILSSPLAVVVKLLSKSSWGQHLKSERGTKRPSTCISTDKTSRKSPESFLLSPETNTGTGKLSSWGSKERHKRNESFTSTEHGIDDVVENSSCTSVNLSELSLDNDSRNSRQMTYFWRRKSMDELKRERQELNSSHKTAKIEEIYSSEVQMETFRETRSNRSGESDLTIFGYVKPKTTSNVGEQLSGRTKQKRITSYTFKPGLIRTFMSKVRLAVQVRKEPEKCEELPDLTRKSSVTPSTINSENTPSAAEAGARETEILSTQTLYSTQEQKRVSEDSKMEDKISRPKCKSEGNNMISVLEAKDREDMDKTLENDDDQANPCTTAKQQLSSEMQKNNDVVPSNGYKMISAAAKKFDFDESAVGALICVLSDESLV